METGQPSQELREGYIRPGMKEAWEAKWNDSIRSFCLPRKLNQGNFGRWLRGLKSSRSFVALMEEYLALEPGMALEPVPQPPQLPGRIQPMELRDILDEIVCTVLTTNITSINFITEELSYKTIEELDSNRLWVLCRLDSARRLRQGRIGNTFFFLSRKCSGDSVYHTLNFAMTRLNHFLPQYVNFYAIGKSDIVETVILTVKDFSKRTIFWVGTDEAIAKHLAPPEAVTGELLS